MNKYTLKVGVYYYWSYDYRWTLYKENAAFMDKKEIDDIMLHIDNPLNETEIFIESQHVSA